MVGKHSLSSGQGQNGDTKGNGAWPGKKGDLESGNGHGNAPARPDMFRFKDAATAALADHRREELKTQLLTGVDRDQLEKFRKSDEELKGMKNKKVRAFYEAQNARLNDWLEVDAIVMAVADDVLDSMNLDADGDGIRERTGGLRDVGENLTTLLPEEVQEERASGNKKARWAININVIANILLLAAK
ncbi:hypothetical protein LTR28_001616, partial [Elasticomyces elasticus]